MYGVSLGISVRIVDHVPLTICSVICSDFEGMLSSGGYVEGVAFAGVKSL